jgi:hypothetical protein
MKEEKEVEIIFKDNNHIQTCMNCKHGDLEHDSEICFPCIRLIEDNWEAEDVR